MVGLASRILKYLKRKLPTPVLHVLGDSHCQVFEYIGTKRRKFNIDYKIECCVVQGATTMGLANPHSKTQAMPIYYEYLKKVKRRDFVILMLGEVDCGFVIWYRAQKYGMSISSQFETSLTNYEMLIEEVMKATKKVIVCATPLPTIPDNSGEFGDVANKRFEVKATLKERTDLTRDYNRRLRKICDERKIIFLNYENEIIDQATGTVSNEFRNENEKDHHLSNNSFSAILAPKLLASMKSY